MTVVKSYHKVPGDGRRQYINKISPDIFNYFGLQQ